VLLFKILIAKRNLISIQQYQHKQRLHINKLYTLNVQLQSSGQLHPFLITSLYNPMSHKNFLTETANVEFMTSFIDIAISR